MYNEPGRKKQWYLVSTAYKAGVQMAKEVTVEG